MYDKDIYIDENVSDEDASIIEKIITQVPEIAFLSEEGIDALLDVIDQMNEGPGDDQYE